MIKIITTGGTIGGLDYKDIAKISSKNEIDISKLLEIANITEPHTIQTLFNKDSRHILEEDRKLIVNTIENSNENKILITHGTYTMAETAKYLGSLNLNKTIVLTGSFILGNKNNTDAYSNLGFAIDSFQFLNNGVYIAMNGKVFTYDNVIKNTEKSKFEEEN